MPDVTRPVVGWKLILLIGVIGTFPLVAAAAPTKQDAPCTPPECYTPPPETNPQPQTNPHSVMIPWGGFTDGRLNPEMAEYYSIWCLDGVVRVLRGVPTTALVDDIPISHVSSLADGSQLLRQSGLTVIRNADTITLYGGNGNLSAPGSKSFLLADCLEHNGVLDLVQAEPNLDQAETSPESTPEVTAEPQTSYYGFVTLPGNNDLDNLQWLALQFVRDICGVPYGVMVFMIPAAWTWRGRRKRFNTR